MALETLPILGRLRDRLRQWFGVRAVGQLDRAIRAGDTTTILDLLQRVYLASATSAYGVHGELVTVPALDEDRLSEFARAASRFAASAANRAQGIDLLTPEAQANYTDIVIDQGLGQGYEYGAWQATVHALEPLEWKTWTRIYPVKEPRDWHDALNGHTIQRHAMFVMPGGPNAGAECAGPHDWDGLDDPAEWIHCGHGLVYTPYAEFTDILH